MDQGLLSSQKCIRNINISRNMRLLFLNERSISSRQFNSAIGPIAHKLLRNSSTLGNYRFNDELV
ncbi:hypothetical protein S245_063343 [Arachis hypogaea]